MDIQEFVKTVNSWEAKASRLLGFISMVPRSIFYSHCQSIYNTEQENRDMDTLKKMGFNPVNPNTHVYQMLVKDIKQAGGGGAEIMQFFVDAVACCDNFAFRALPGGFMPAGVATEVKQARDLNMNIIELPNFTCRQYLGIPETRDYLKECGTR